MVAAAAFLINQATTPPRPQGSRDDCIVFSARVMCCTFPPVGATPRSIFRYGVSFAETYTLFVSCASFKQMWTKFIGSLLQFNHQLILILKGTHHTQKPQTICTMGTRECTYICLLVLMLSNTKESIGVANFFLDEDDAGFRPAKLFHSTRGIRSLQTAAGVSSPSDMHPDGHP